jgi:hypothetical protein
MQDFKKPLVWQKAHELTLRLYELTATFPRDDAYGLTGQVRRASSSIPANIVEGCGREGNWNLRDSSLSPWDQQVNSNIICFLRET